MIIYTNHRRRRRHFAERYSSVAPYGLQIFSWRGLSTSGLDDRTTATLTMSMSGLGATSRLDRLRSCCWDRCEPDAPTVADDADDSAAGRFEMVPQPSCCAGTVTVVVAAAAAAAAAATAAAIEAVVVVVVVTADSSSVFGGVGGIPW